MAHNRQHDELIPGTGVTSRKIEALGRTVTATAHHLIGPTADATTSSYHAAMSELHRELRRPQIQRGVLALVRNSPSESIRARLSRAEIEHRALTAIPEDLLKDVPKEDHAYSLFEGFQASLPEDDGETEHRKRHRRHRSRNEPKMLEDGKEEEGGPPALAKLQRGRDRVAHRLEMMGVRKNMCSAEILEIDKKIANLGKVRGIVLERLSDLEEDEVKVEAELLEMDHKVEEMQELLEQEAEVANLEPMTPATTESASIADGEDEDGVATPTGSPTFMSQSIYEKLPSPKSAKRHRPPRRRSAAVRHGHFEPGTRLRVLPAHTDMVTALDFDAPFGTMVTAALDDTVRVWDLNRGRCLGLLEGHRASVRCLQVEDNLVATGSIDASVRLWDLSQAEYPTPAASNSIHHSADPEDDGLDSPSNPDDTFSTAPPPSSMADTPVFNLSAHVAEVTALHFHKDTLVSGSADKTLRQWDLVKGRCVQTLDVLWAAAQASTPVSSTSTRSSTGGRSAPNGGVATAGWSSTSMARLSDPEADFVGALQCFDAALACGTADGMVRLWDLRSGQVHRSLVGHTAPVSALQFDDVRLVTGSLDRSIRIWDLRTGAIFDAYAYDRPVTAMMFDARRIVAAAGEPVAKIYDKSDDRHWDCGMVDDEETEEGAVAVQGQSVVERVRIKDGFLLEGRRNGDVGVWTC